MQVLDELSGLLVAAKVSIEAVVESLRVRFQLVHEVIDHTLPVTRSSAAVEPIGNVSDELRDIFVIPLDELPEVHTSLLQVASANHSGALVFRHAANLNGTSVHCVALPPTSDKMWETTIKTITNTIGAALALTLLVGVSTAEAKGCIKGAIVGGAAGSMAGHGKMGAAAGCAVGHHKANKKDQQQGVSQGQQGQGQPQ
ncbi:hypothetical protein DHODJN_14210 [Methylorubrum extorquens]